MRYAPVLGAALVATAALLSLPALAGERYPEEIGIGPPARCTRIPFLCTEGPADNFYHGAWYAVQPTALYRGRLPAVLSIRRLSRRPADLSLLGLGRVHVTF
jgi:hypothetical protein